MIIRFFKFPESEKTYGEWLSSSDVIDFLSAQNKSQAAKYNARGIGRILGKNTDMKKRSGGVTKYYLKTVVDSSNNSGGESGSESDVFKSVDENDDLPF